MTTSYQDALPVGCHWSMIMKAGYQLRLIDVNGIIWLVGYVEMFCVAFYC